MGSSFPPVASASSSAVTREAMSAELLDAETESLPVLVYRLALFYRQEGHETRAREILREARSLAEAAGRVRLVREIDQRMEERP